MTRTTKAFDEIFGVVVQQSPTLRRLLFRVKRSHSGYYLLLPHDSDGTRLHDGTAWNPHASYHPSGQRHVKTYNECVFSPEQRQRPDDTFAGWEHLFDAALKPGDWARSPIVSDPGEYADLFVTDECALNLQDSYVVSLQLVAPGVSPAYVPYGTVLVGTHTFRCKPPWVHASLWRSQAESTRSDA